MLRRILKAPDNHRGDIRYTQWVCNLENHLLEEVDDKDICRTLLSMAEVLIVSNNNGCNIDNGCYLLQRKSLKTLVQFRKVQFGSVQDGVYALGKAHNMYAVHSVSHNLPYVLGRSVEKSKSVINC